MKSILITVCLQNDFVKPIGKYDNLPNLLHIGYEESRRLIGINQENSPISIFMNWINSNSEDINIINIRDWHDINDINQKKHLEKFGDHCLVNTEGAEFVFKISDNHMIIDSYGLNDFIENKLNNYLSKFENENLRVGIIGVWTEAKVLFLAYDILSRFPNFDLSVCSALTASSSLNNHYISLEQMNKILGVKIINSIGEFSKFISWNKKNLEIPIKNQQENPIINIKNPIEISDIDLKLIKYVFRGSKTLDLNVLDGGFSGNLVLGTKSKDIEGHEEAQHVLKIGQQELIGQERTSFEKIEQILGNNAPRIIEFADYLGRGILKYRYASMSNGNSNSFQKLFMKNTPMRKINKYLKGLFLEQLMKLYSASKYEKLNLLEYYGFSKSSIENIKKNISNIYKGDILDYELEIIKGLKTYNPYYFYKDELNKIITKTDGYSYVSYIHGDLNGANIIIDSHENIWIIDFFYTHRGHILKDLIKLENDLLYIFTNLNSKKDFIEAIKISDVLLKTNDLAAKLPKLEFKNKNFQRTYDTLKLLRSFYPKLIKSDRNPNQLFIGQLRYAMHTLVFEECNIWQKKWALYNAGNFCKKILEKFKEDTSLRIDLIPKNIINNKVLGLTILPGRKDFSRNLEEDINEIKKQNINVIIPLLTKDEIERYGVSELLEKYKSSGFEVKQLSINDQKTPSKKEVDKIIDYISLKFKENKSVLLHCVGGLGRSGLIAACYLKSLGISYEESINIVRNNRDIRAIETEEQENFVKEYLYKLE